MLMTTIAVIGAQGHFGSRLCERLTEIVPKTRLLRTQNKGSSIEVARQADIVALAVRTIQMDRTLDEIVAVLKQGAIVVSFVGRSPLANIVARTKRNAIRVMIDPFWNMGAYVESGAVGAQTMEIIGRLTKTPPLGLRSDEELDRYTNLLAHLFAALLLQRLGRIGHADAHLEFLAHEFSEFGRAFTPKEFETYALRENAEESLKTIATPGGITEKAVELLEAGAEPSAIQKILVNL